MTAFEPKEASLPLKTRQSGYLTLFEEKMKKAEMAEPAIASFGLHLNRLVEGERGTLSESAIEPLAALADSERLGEHRETGRSALDKVVVIKLNGGLGTGMGLDRAKSLLPVRDGLSFLDIIARQTLALRENTGVKIPLLFMNSFRTAEDTETTLESYPDLAVNDLPLGFLQSMVPKVNEADLTPAEHAENPELGWCPPGHGDLYTSIASSGVLDQLLGHGLEYAFVSNADNLGAVFDPALLGYMVHEGLDILLEAADRTRADRKGGHLCRLTDGRLALRESAQCPAEDTEAFQDIERHRYFNSNNLWLHLPTLAKQLANHGGFLPLATLVNHKTLDPRDPTSPPVVQLETAMGTAISFFQRAAAVRIPRRRFSPVKNTNDLLGVRSDAFVLTDDSRVVLHRDRNDPPVIRLDSRYYKMIDRFEDRFPNGPPSLLSCESLQVEGDITFGSGIVVEGSAHVRASEPTSVREGTTLSGSVDL
jgi:UTP--glucose-1-phosphate uridylyltransferase